MSDDNHILGIITAQDVIKVVGDEMGEDYAKLGGLIAEEDLREPLQISVKKRLPWLIMLLFLGMVVSSVVSFFEGTVLSRLTVLICFQSLILDMAGNVGTQSLAVAIRVLIDSGVNKEQKLRMIFKEMGTGGFNGLILGVVSSVFIGIYIIFSKQMPVGYAFAISICAGIALFLSMVVSSLVGTIVPVFFKHVGVDPAVASGPLITTINDLVGVVSYYGLAWIFLIDILHLG